MCGTSKSAPESESVLESDSAPGCAPKNGSWTGHGWEVWFCGAGSGLSPPPPLASSLRSIRSDRCDSWPAVAEHTKTRVRSASGAHSATSWAPAPPPRRSAWADWAPCRWRWRASCGLNTEAPEPEHRPPEPTGQPERHLLADGRRLVGLGLGQLGLLEGQRAGPLRARLVRGDEELEQALGGRRLQLALHLEGGLRAAGRVWSCLRCAHLVQRQEAGLEQRRVLRQQLPHAAHVRRLGRLQVLRQRMVC